MSKIAHLKLGKYVRWIIREFSRNLNIMDNGKLNQSEKLINYFLKTQAYKITCSNCGYKDDLYHIQRDCVFYNSQKCKKEFGEKEVLIYRVSYWYQPFKVIG